jgi:hypothetical protein
MPNGIRQPALGSLHTPSRHHEHEQYSARWRAAEFFVLSLIVGLSAA